MAGKKKHKFATIGEYLGKSGNMAAIAGLVSDLDRLTALLHSALPMTRDLCHCGAIDYANDLIVLFANSNAAFYLVNNLIPTIQDALFANGVHFTKILVKVRPGSTAAKVKPKRKITPEQYSMLKKFAEAIDRPDLLKPVNNEEEPTTLEDWQIKL